MKNLILIPILALMLFGLVGCSGGVFHSTGTLGEIAKICQESGGNFYYYTHQGGDEPVCISKSAEKFTHSY